MASSTDMLTTIAAIRAQLDALEKMVTPAPPVVVPALLLPSQLVTPVAPVAPEAKKAAGRPKKVTLPFPALPAAGSEAPGPEAYRVVAADIKPDVCVGRRIVAADKRWSVAIHTEAQCGGAVADGSDLCAGCRAKEARYLAEGTKYDRWTGRITEEPLPWVHMLGTAWAAAGLASGRLRWVGADAGTASDSGSVSSAGSAAPSAKAAKAEAKAIEKAAKAEAKAVAKAAAKAAKEEAKAAAKVAKEEAKAAAKAAKKA